MHRPRIRATLMSLTILCGLGPRAVAQLPTLKGDPMVVDGEIADVVLRRMRDDLGNLKSAEKQYFEDHKEYGRALRRTQGKGVSLTPSPGTTITLLYVTQSSWAGRATHEWLPGVSCVIYMGDVPVLRLPHTTRQHRAPGGAGKVVCDEVKS